MAEKVKTLLIRFSNTISQEEVELFRGAVVHAVGNSNVLFHNHLDNDKLRYAYPLIQYKRIGGKAAILCIGEGTEAIGEFFSSCNFDVWIGDRHTRLEVERVQAGQGIVQLWDSQFAYHIRKWLPLNQENYEKFLTLENLADRYAMLERMLIGNILSFATGIGIHFDENVWAKITSAEEPRFIRYKGVKMMSFDAEFKTNVSLPDYVGIGKGVSLGMGTVVKDYSFNPPRMSQKVFLLGGHDLEMQTIKEMIYTHLDCIVVDKNLQWDNAKLSVYLDELQQYADKEIYGIELAEDVVLTEELKTHYHRIDHHNDMNGLPSSLEQTAAVLGMDLNRKQRLIAANDSGYIPAMKALQASEDEIREIRLHDRAAQGVTEDDELLAEKSITESFEKFDNIYIVKSLTSKFSTICDRLYPYKRLFIYTDNEWMFYGEGKADLVKQFSEEIEKKNVFHGGGEYGYIGTVKNVYEKEIIHAFANQIKNQYVSN